MSTDLSPDILQSISDTLNVIGPKVNQIADASDPEAMRLNLTMATIAAIAGIFGALFGFLGFWFSKKTAVNVARTNRKNRIRISDRLIMVVYKRLVYVRAMINNPSLISQNLFRTIYLPAFEDCFILEDYRNDAKRYANLMSLKNQMSKYNSAVDACINKLDNAIALSNRDMLDLIETPVKVLIALFHINKRKKRNYADHLVSVIIDYHFSHINDSSLSSYDNVSYELPNANETGLSYFSKLCEQGDMKSCRESLKKYSEGSLEQILATYMDSGSMGMYLQLLEQAAVLEDKDNKGIISWFSAAWGLDSAIVSEQIRVYNAMTI